MSALVLLFILALIAVAGYAFGWLIAWVQVRFSTLAALGAFFLIAGLALGSVALAGLIALGAFA